MNEIMIRAIVSLEEYLNVIFAKYISDVEIVVNANISLVELQDKTDKQADMLRKYADALKHYKETAAKRANFGHVLYLLTHAHTVTVELIDTLEKAEHYQKANPVGYIKIIRDKRVKLAHYCEDLLSEKELAA